MIRLFYGLGKFTQYLVDTVIIAQAKLKFLDYYQYPDPYTNYAGFKSHCLAWHGRSTLENTELHWQYPVAVKEAKSQSYIPVLMVDIMRWWKVTELYLFIHDYLRKTTPRRSLQILQRLLDVPMFWWNNVKAEWKPSIYGNQEIVQQ